MHGRFIYTPDHFDKRIKRDEEWGGGGVGGRSSFFLLAGAWDA